LKRTALPGGIETRRPSRIASDASFADARLNTPNPRSSMRSPVESRFLHAVEKRFSTASSALVFGDPGAVHHFIDDVELDHGRLRGSGKLSQVIDAKGIEQIVNSACLSRKMTAHQPGNL